MVEETMVNKLGHEPSSRDDGLKSMGVFDTIE
jgi:hypothetical protein